MATHILCITQSDTLFLNPSGNLISFPIAVNPGDARKKKLTPLVVAAIGVEKTGIIDVRLYSSESPIDLWAFVNCVWAFNRNFQGCPETLIVQSQVYDWEGTRDFTNKLSQEGISIKLSKKPEIHFKKIEKMAKVLSSTVDFDLDPDPEWDKERNIKRTREMLLEAGYPILEFEDLDSKGPLGRANLILKLIVTQGFFTKTINPLPTTSGHSIFPKTQSMPYAPWMELSCKNIERIKSDQYLFIQEKKEFSRGDVTHDNYVSNWTFPHDKIREENLTQWNFRGLDTVLDCLIERDLGVINSRFGAATISEFRSGRRSIPALTGREIFWEIKYPGAVFKASKVSEVRCIFGWFNDSSEGSTYIINLEKSFALITLAKKSFIAIVIDNRLNTDSIIKATKSRIVDMRTERSTILIKKMRDYNSGLSNIYQLKRDIFSELKRFSEATSPARP